MRLSRRGLLAASATLPLARHARAQAASPTLRVGVLNDQSGPYRDTSGTTSVVCTRQAVAEFASAHGLTVEVIAADHQNKPDIGVSIVRQWFDRDGVDMVVDVPTSSVALAVNSVCAEKNKVYINVGAGTADLTGSQCTPNTIHWAYDTYMLARSTAGSIVKAGGDSWYFITADYVFGQQLQRDASHFVTAAGGHVLGASPYPFPGTSDFSSFLISAQSSGAKVLGLANAGADSINCIKQAHEFGLSNKMKIAALLIYITDVHALGLDTAAGLNLTESFYWDLNDHTRAFTKRVLPQTPNNYPNMNHAGCYAGTLHWMKACAAMGAAAAKADGAATVAKMKATETDDDCFGRRRIRADGRLLVPAYLFEVKQPGESRGPWDLFKQVAVTAPDDAAPPIATSGCKLVHS